MARHRITELSQPHGLRSSCAIDSELSSVRELRRDRTEYRNERISTRANSYVDGEEKEESIFFRN